MHTRTQAVPSIAGLQRSVPFLRWVPPQAVEALAALRDNDLTDDHVKGFLCETWDNCDKIERGLLERTETSLTATPLP